MPLLHKEGFQVLQYMTLQGERTFNQATGYVTSSRGGKDGAQGRGGNPALADLRTRRPGFGHSSSTLLLQA